MWQIYGAIQGDGATHEAACDVITVQLATLPTTMAR
jgi:hypothetical protein